MKTYGAMLGLDEVGMDIAATMHDDYETQFAEMKRAAIDPIKALETSLWTMDMETREFSGPSREQIEQLYTMRRSAVEQVHGVDSAFFENIGAALLDDDDAGLLERVKMHRQRRVYNRGAGGGNMVMAGGPGMSFRGVGDSDEGRVDLAALVDELELDAEVRETIDPTLMDYERVVTDAFRTSYLAAMRMQEQMDAMTAEATTVDDDGARVRAGTNMMQVMQTDGAAAQEAKRALIDRNRATLESLESLLPAEDAESLRRAFEQKAFPGVFRDPKAATPVLEHALGLDDLTDRQRTAIQEASLAYRAAYDELCRAMVVLAAEGAGEGGMFSPDRDWNAFQERQRKLEQLRFDRDEASDKARLRLRGVLSEDQVARVRGLGSE